MNNSTIFDILKKLNIKLEDIQDKNIHLIVNTLLQLIEQLASENDSSKSTIQKLKDEINRLKGELGKPDIKPPKKKKKKPNNHSSEKDRNQRKPPKEKESKVKNHKIKIDRVEVCKVDKDTLPEDAEFKGYQSSIVQEIIIKTDNVEYKREIYYSPSLAKDLPSGVQGEFGPGIRSLILTFKHICNISEPKIKEFFFNIGILASFILPQK